MGKFKEFIKAYWGSIIFITMMFFVICLGIFGMYRLGKQMVKDFKPLKDAQQDNKELFIPELPLNDNIKSISFIYTRYDNEYYGTVTTYHEIFGEIVIKFRTIGHKRTKNKLNEILSKLNQPDR